MAVREVLARFQALLKRLREHPLQVPVGGEAGIAFRQQNRPDRNGRQRGAGKCKQTDRFGNESGVRSL